MKMQQIPTWRKREMYLGWCNAIRHKQSIIHKGPFVAKQYRTTFGEEPPLEWQLEASL